MTAHLSGAEVRHADLHGCLRLAGAPGLALRRASSIDVPLQAVQRIPHHIRAALEVAEVALQELHLLAEGVVGSRLHNNHMHIEVHIDTQLALDL